MVSLSGVAAAQQPTPRDTTPAPSTQHPAPSTQHPAPVIQGITVIGSPEAHASLRSRLREVPGSVALVEGAQLRATRQANFTDVLRMTPGVFVQPRFGAADESQISIRGSGLRGNFHLRGLSVLVNGMPYRNADGFSDFESLELLTAENVQVWKGGNALRYGGSTLGGGINIETRTGHTAGPITAHADGGSFGFFKGQLASGGMRGGFDYYASYARTQLDGYRAWSDQGRDRVNLHAGWVVSPRLDVRTFALYANVREHLPGALTQAEFDGNPRQAVANNVTNQWGRDYQLYHTGFQARATPSEHGMLEVAPYFQYRDIDHPIFQVIAQVSRDAGVEARYENTAPLGERRNRLTLGAQYARGNIANRQYVNNGGAHGALTKDQLDVAGTQALYAEDVIGLAGRLSAVAGLRYETSMRGTTDNFFSNGDQSDRRNYSALLPKLGLLLDLADGRSQVYVNASRSFEPPLLLELNSLAVPGFIALRPQCAWQAELGTRGRSGWLQWDVSVYDAELTDEITNINVQPFPGAPFTVPTYRNIDRSRHFGLEAALGLRVARGLDAQVAYTWARYRFVEDSLHAGYLIPGAPNQMINAELRYRHPSGLSLTPRVDWVPQSYFVDNANTVRNKAWASLGIRADYLLGATGANIFAEVRNLADAKYSGSVQVNDANGRFFEPADGRAVYLGVHWQR